MSSSDTKTRRQQTLNVCEQMLDHAGRNLTSFSTFITDEDFRGDSSLKDFRIIHEDLDFMSSAPTGGGKEWFIPLSTDQVHSQVNKFKDSSARLSDPKKNDPSYGGMSLGQDIGCYSYLLPKSKWKEARYVSFLQLHYPCYMNSSKDWESHSVIWETRTAATSDNSLCSLAKHVPYYTKQSRTPLLAPSPMSTDMLTTEKLHRSCRR